EPEDRAGGADPRRAGLSCAVPRRPHRLRSAAGQPGEGAGDHRRRRPGPAEGRSGVLGRGLAVGRGAAHGRGMSHARHAARTVRASREMIEASGAVIARRLEIMAEGARDPLKADLRELALMGSEKVEALGASAAAGLTGAAALATGGAAVAARETAAARDAMGAVLGAAGPAEALAAQASWAAGAMNRTMRDGWAVAATMLKLQADALAPIHAAATANARRLKK